MKRFMTATALVTVIATGAFAADDFSTTTINQYIRGGRDAYQSSLLLVSQCRLVDIRQVL